MFVGEAVSLMRYTRFMTHCFITFEQFTHKMLRGLCQKPYTKLISKTEIHKCMKEPPTPPAELNIDMECAVNRCLVWFGFLWTNRFL